MAHVFVVAADLMALACDAWLVPGSATPGHTWDKALPPRDRRLPCPADWGRPGAPRACLLAEVDAPEPLPFLCDIVGHDRHPASWWVDGARDFVRTAAATLRERGRKPAHRRAKHLVALPLVGTGGGGAGHISGEVVAELLSALREEADAADVDVALALLSGPAYAAAQNVRKESDDAWPELPPDLAAEADRLAELARKGDLVVFFGAGVSQPAGMPGWEALLAELAAEAAGLASEADQKALRGLGELDRAAVIRNRLPQGVGIGEATARLIQRRASRHALGHALLAALPVDELITTNFDALFELASQAIGRPCKVLPGGAAGRGERFLLKMHGSVERPESIILTREDFLRFQENRSALAGLVQALLLTRHMLFVGFSLSDDNFHRIAHAVRQALGAQRIFGTTLVVDPNRLSHALWDKDLTWVAFDRTADGEPRPRAEQTRLIDIFLDRLAARSATATAHLGDHAYEGALSAGERALRDRLLRLIDEVGDDERQTSAWAEVARALARLGIRPRGDRDPDPASSRRGARPRGRGSS